MTARHRCITDPGQHDALSRCWRRYHHFKASGRRWWKNWTNRRERRAEARDLRDGEK